MRILICGDRNWTDVDMIRKRLVDYGRDVDTVIEGEARGADRFARGVAESMGLKVMPFPADWTKYHKAAGAIRNQQMLDEGKPDEVWAFHDDLGNSKGTKDMVDRARKAGLPTWLFGHVKDVGWNFDKRRKP